MTDDVLESAFTIKRLSEARLHTDWTAGHGNADLSRRTCARAIKEAARFGVQCALVGPIFL